MLRSKLYVTAASHSHRRRHRPPRRSGTPQRRRLTPGAAGRAKDNDKIRRYRRNDTNAYDFIPFAVESFGRLSPKAMERLNTLATAAAGASAVDKGNFVTNALREISVALCRGNAQVYRHGEAAFARLSGVAMVPGASCPTAEVH